MSSVAEMGFFCLLIFSSLFSATSGAHLCLNDQSSSLLQLKASFAIDMAASSSCNTTTAASAVSDWTEGTDCCSWGGVRCDNSTGAVVELDLSCSHLHGAINGGSSLFRLSHLQLLNLAHNSFNGSQILPRFAEFKNLTYLNLSNSGFSGEVPPEISSLTELVSLDLSCNNFTGEFPILEIEKLTHLDISQNNLSGEIPFVRLPALSFVDFSQNQFVGVLPPWLYDSPSLQVLHLSKNKLAGSIRDFKSRFLESLDLSNNRFDGSVPFSIFDLVNLTNLELQWNNLSGSVDMESLSKLKNLKSLDLSHNHLSVNNNVRNSLAELESLSLASCNLTEFPTLLQTTKNLVFLDLSNNRIHGNFPKWLLKVGTDSLRFLNLTQNLLTSVNLTPWKNLGTIDLRSNLLEGSVPLLPPATTYFSISNNKITGEIPLFLCKMNLFRILDLSINRLEGTIPQCLGNFSNRLTVLDLRMNSFHGGIPATFTEGNILRNLDLDGNRLEGPLPESLKNCQKLEVLDLGNNLINDTFPHWLESLPFLQVLVLRSNKFHGHITGPKSAISFPKLRIFDISNNHFSGFLPMNYIKNFKAMEAVDEGRTEVQYMGERYCQDTIIVTMKGLQTQLLRILTIFTTIDLSNNNFHGEIPEAIGGLHSLRQLNLSHNSLSGHIPPSLGNLSVLESLDLSENFLTGEIPRQLTGLTFLAMVDFSHNQLSGAVPRGKQFDTFQNSSFVGNKGLCGSPLSVKCDRDEAHKPSKASDGLGFESAAKKLEWLGLIVGYGCGLLFGIVMCNLVISAAKAKHFLILIEDRWYSYKWSMPFGTRRD